MLIDTHTSYRYRYTLHWSCRVCSVGDELSSLKEDKLITECWSSVDSQSADRNIHSALHNVNNHTCTGIVLSLIHI